MTLQLTFAAMALVTSGISVGMLRRFFIGLLMDIPNERSSHTRPTPRGGGLGFIMAFAVAMALAQRYAPGLLVGTIAPQTWLALVPLALIGVIDDWRNLPSAVRYLVQLGTAWYVVSGYGAFTFPWLDQLGSLAGPLAFVISVICFTALINFYNFMDGLDGLVAGVSAVQLAFLALWCQQPVLWLWVAALVGFLFWNWSPAKIFMGDAGSTILGAVVATALMTQPNSFEQSWASVAILLPLIGDAVYTLARRLSRGENIFQAHRSHIYQRLHQAGWPHGQVAGLYIGATLAIAFGLWQFGTGAAWVSLGATLLALVAGELYLSLSPKVNTYIAPRLASED